MQRCQYTMHIAHTFIRPFDRFNTGVGQLSELFYYIMRGRMGAVKATEWAPGYVLRERQFLNGYCLVLEIQTKCILDVDFRVD